MMRHKTLLAAVLLLLLTSTAWAKMETWSGEVVGIIDGDTIVVLKNGWGVTIRLYGIDCPEMAQPYGKDARSAVSRLAFKKKVVVTERDKDRSGRVVADVGLPECRDLGAELVRQGLAWWYKKYAPNNRPLETLETVARNQKRGLWSDPKPVAPWEWRKSH